MIRYAKLKDLDGKKFKILHAEIANYHKKMDYFFDWSRQWEYPWILKNVPFKKKYKVLDVGGGISHFPSIVAKRVNQVTIGDMYHERMFKTEQKNVDFKKVDISTYESDEKYDVVVCISVLEHVDNYLNALINLKKLVKKGGYLAITLDLFLDNFKPCMKKDIPEIIRILGKDFDLGNIDLSEDVLYEKIKLQEMKFDMPNLYSKNYKNRTSLGIIVKKL